MVGARQSVACCQQKGTREEEISEWGLPGLFPLGIYEKHNSSFFFPACGGILSGTQGFFAYQSPNDTYTHDVNCFWVVKTDEEKVHTVTIVLEQIFINTF